MKTLMMLSGLVNGGGCDIKRDLTLDIAPKLRHFLRMGIIFHSLGFFLFWPIFSMISFHEFPKKLITGISLRFYDKSSQLACNCTLVNLSWIFWESSCKDFKEVKTVWNQRSAMSVWKLNLLSCPIFKEERATSIVISIIPMWFDSDLGCTWLVSRFSWDCIKFQNQQKGQLCSFDTNIKTKHIFLHFHFRPTLELKSRVVLRSCLRQSWKIKTLFLLIFLSFCWRMRSV